MSYAQTAHALAKPYGLDATARPRLTLAPDLSVWQTWADDWAVSLRSEGIAPSTVLPYLRSLGEFATWAAGRKILSPEQVTRRDIRAWVGHFADQPKPNGKPRSATYVAQQLRQLKVFWAWWQLEEDQPTNPARDVPLPRVVAKVTPVLTDTELAALLATAHGASFAARRDTAIMRMLLDSGVRSAELLGLHVADVDVAAGVAQVRHGKGGDARVVAFGAKTAQALGRYLRARASHPDAALPQLFLVLPGRNRGPLRASGLARMLTQRGVAAGVAGSVHPHRFRHTAYDAMEGHVSGGAAMQLMGWKSRAMLDHYGASNASKRAVAAVQLLALGDRV